MCVVSYFFFFLWYSPCSQTAQRQKAVDYGKCGRDVRIVMHLVGTADTVAQWLRSLRSIFMSRDAQAGIFTWPRTAALLGCCQCEKRLCPPKPIKHEIILPINNAPAELLNKAETHGEYCFLFWVIHLCLFRAWSPPTDPDPDPPHVENPQSCALELMWRPTAAFPVNCIDVSGRIL